MAYQNLKDAGLLDSCQIKEVIKEYLRFETRFVMENIWLRRQHRQHVMQSFNQSDINNFKKMVCRENCVIVTAHFSGLMEIVELSRLTGCPATLIAANTMTQPWSCATPVQRSMIMLYRSWMNHQPLIFSDEENMMEKSYNVLLSKKSMIVAADVPGYKGVQVPMFGKSLWVPAGPAIMAWKCNVPILVAIPWASAFDKPYRIFLRKIPASNDMNAVMAKIFEYIETVVRLNPAGWNGWLYLHRMVAQ
ncbi:MAG: hypothetical protein HQK61_06550 [Desulfamplus sp.]|nr:hypothetical protein [Desulfamplus sp.]